MVTVGYLLEVIPDSREKKPTDDNRLKPIHHTIIVLRPLTAEGDESLSEEVSIKGAFTLDIKKGTMITVHKNGVGDQRVQLV